MACFLCGRGIPGCSCEKEKPQQSTFTNIATGEEKKVGRPPKPDDEIGKSAGRKRAGHAIEDKLRNSGICQWAGKANVGGGKHPIIGCINNEAKHVHHGPDKNTSNNQEGNIHNICTSCHNRWHAANDKDHDATIPHEPRDATRKELLRAMAGEYLMEIDDD